LDILFAEKKRPLYLENNIIQSTFTEKLPVLKTTCMRRGATGLKVNNVVNSGKL